MKIVHSISSHESPACVIDQCYNLLTAGEGDNIVIHINKTVEHVHDYLQNVINNDFFMRQNNSEQKKI